METKGKSGGPRDSKKSVLIIESPFKGIKRRTDILKYISEEDVSLMRFYYTGNREISETTHAPDGSYLTKDIFLSKYFAFYPNADEVISRRFSDIVGGNSSGITEFEFKDGRKREVETVRYHLNGEAVDRIATLTYCNIDGVLPVWSRNTGGKRFGRARNSIQNFFKGIQNLNPDLKIESRPVEEISPYNVLKEWGFINHSKF